MCSVAVAHCTTSLPHTVAHPAPIFLGLAPEIMIQHQPALVWCLQLFALRGVVVELENTD